MAHSTQRRNKIMDKTSNQILCTLYYNGRDMFSRETNIQNDVLYKSQVSIEYKDIDSNTCLPPII